MGNPATHMSSPTTSGIGGTSPLFREFGDYRVATAGFHHSSADRKITPRRLIDELPQTLGRGANLIVDLDDLPLERRARRCGNAFRYSRGAGRSCSRRRLSARVFRYGVGDPKRVTDEGRSLRVCIRFCRLL
jgi:hypothetical protein